MSHPSLGMPPRDPSAGDPAAAAALRRAGARLGTRTLEAAMAAVPTMKDRYDELALENLRSDVLAFVGRLAVAVEANDPRLMGAFAEQVAIRFRKRGVPMDDVVALCEGLRQSSVAVVPADAAHRIDAAIDEAIAVFRWHRRLAGDARKRHPLLAFIYKGA